MQNQNIEEMSKQVERLGWFVAEMYKIIQKMCKWRLDSLFLQKAPRREDILLEMENFKKLSLQAEKEGLSPFIQENRRTAIESLKFFTDIVPELNELQ